MRKAHVLLLSLFAPLTVFADPLPPLRLVLTSRIEGRFSTLGCLGNTAPSNLAEAAAAIQAEPGALALDAGDLIGMAGLAWLAVEHDPVGLAVAAKAAGLRALAIGHRDLASPRPTLVAAARALGAQDLRYVLSNLHCAPEARALCEAVVDADDPPLVLDTPQGRVGLVVLLAPAALDRIARSSALGLKLDDPVKALARAMAAARAAGADRVVAIFDPIRERSVDDMLALVDAAGPGKGPDVLIVSGLPEKIAALRSVGGVPVIAPRNGHAVVVDLGSPGLVAPGASGTPPPEVFAFGERTAEWLCKTHAVPLPGGQFSGAIDREALAGLLLDVLREQAHADVGIINRGAIRDPQLFPLRGALTRLHVAAVLPFGDSVHAAPVSGAVLATLMKSPRAAEFHFRGLTLESGRVKVNGRPIEETARYRVVTTGFVADGGEGGLGEGAPPLPQLGKLEVVPTLLGWVARPRKGEILRATVDPAQHARWTLGVTLDAAFTSTNISNPGKYDDAQFARLESLGFRGDLQLRADSDQPRWRWENGFRLRYGFQGDRTAPDTTKVLETSDLISGRSTLALRTVGPPRWWLPHPYAESYTESEISRPEPIEGMEVRTWHHLETRLTAGLRLQLLDKLSIGASLGADWEVLQKPRVYPVAVIVAGWTLLPMDLFKVLGRAVRGESVLDVAWRDPTGSSDVTVRVGAKVAFPLLDYLAITVGYDLFVRRSGSGSWGVAGDATIGLAVAARRAFQSGY